MLSILARTFMIATQTNEQSKMKSPDHSNTRKQRWLPENHWWKECKRASFSQCD